jgi:hypothetical protein
MKHKGIKAALASAAMLASTVAMSAPAEATWKERCVSWGGTFNAHADSVCVEVEWWTINSGEGVAIDTVRLSYLGDMERSGLGVDGHSLRVVNMETLDVKWSKSGTECNIDGDGTTGSRTYTMPDGQLRLINAGWAQVSYSGTARRDNDPDKDFTIVVNFGPNY